AKWTIPGGAQLQRQSASSRRRRTAKQDRLRHGPSCRITRCSHYCLNVRFAGRRTERLEAKLGHMRLAVGEPGNSRLAMERKTIALLGKARLVRQRVWGNKTLHRTARPPTRL